MLIGPAMFCFSLLTVENKYLYSLENELNSCFLTGNKAKSFIYT